MTTNINTNDAEKKENISAPLPRGGHQPDFRGTPEERFWRKVRKGDGCWEWTAYLDRQGYGRFRLRPRLAPLGAHRFSWEISVGPIPDGLLVLHRCDNTKCVRPDHLFLGTQLDNQRDMSAKGRARGQPFAPRRRLTALRGGASC